MLEELLQQANERQHGGDGVAWLERLLCKRERFVDLNELTLHHYFHPLMKRRTSIKVTLPAVWSSNPELRADPWFGKYASALDDPYKALPPSLIDGKPRVVKDGLGAMDAYAEALCRAGWEDEAVREQWLNLLRKYCELDTMAMIMIWKHWRSRLE